MSMMMTTSMRPSPAHWARLLAVGLCTLAMPRAARAQWRDAVAVSAVPVASAGQSTQRLPLDGAPNDSTWHAGGFWRWTGIGVLSGTVASLGWLALQARENSDGSMISPVIPILFVGGVGGAGGGLIGALLYTASHARAEPPR